MLYSLSDFLQKYNNIRQLCIKTPLLTNINFTSKFSQKKIFYDILSRMGSLANLYGEIAIFQAMKSD